MDAANDGGGPQDAAIDTGPVFDAGALACRWTSGPIMTSLVQFAGLNTDFNEMEAFLTFDGLRLYFYSNRTGAGDVYMATRASSTDSFLNETLVPWASSALVETRVETSRDELTAVVAAEWAGTEGGSDLWIGSRTDPGSPFDSFTNLSALNTAGEEVDPHLSADGLRLYFANDQGGAPATNKYQILVAERTTTTSEFGAPHVIEELADLEYDNANATLSGDETVVVFTSTRPRTVGGASDANIWYATRASLTTAFGTPVPLPVPINLDSTVDYEPFLSADGCQLIFSSMRNAPGDADLFMASFD